MLPGMMRSGACTSETDLSDCAMSGRTKRSIVPGEIVDSITTHAPSGHTFSTSCTAAQTNFASTFLLNGS